MEQFFLDRCNWYCKIERKHWVFGVEFLLPGGSLHSRMDTAAADYFNHVLKEMYCHLNLTTTINPIVVPFVCFGRCFYHDEGNDSILLQTSKGLFLQKLVSGSQPGQAAAKERRVMRGLLMQADQAE